MKEDTSEVPNKKTNNSFDALLADIIHEEERKRNQKYEDKARPGHSLDKDNVTFERKEDRTLIHSFRFAWQGLMYAFKHERNMRIHSGFAIGALIAGGIMRFSGIEMAFLFLVITMVLLLELVNTALELTLDHTHGSTFHPLVKVIKDVVAGGVLLSVVNAVIVGAILFFRRVF